MTTPITPFDELDGVIELLLDQSQEIKDKVDELYESCCVPKFIMKVFPDDMFRDDPYDPSDILKLNIPQAIKIVEDKIKRLNKMDYYKIQYIFESDEKHAEEEMQYLSSTLYHTLDELNGEQLPKWNARKIQSIMRMHKQRKSYLEMQSFKPDGAGFLKAKAEFEELQMT